VGRGRDLGVGSARETLTNRGKDAQRTGEKGFHAKRNPAKPIERIFQYPGFEAALRREKRGEKAKEGKPEEAFLGTGEENH